MKSISINNSEEPSPEDLSKYILHCKVNSFEILKAKDNNDQPPIPIKQIPPNQPLKSLIDLVNNSKQKDSTNYNSLNNSKSYKSSPKYQQFDLQNVTYTLMKDFCQLKIRKEEKFMERMKFDIYKRQIKEEKVNELVDKNKLHISEVERIKGFNRLISDANRRIEAQDNLNKMKERLRENDPFFSSNTSRRYNNDEWNEIYDKRFKQFEEDSMKKIKNKCKEKQEQKKLKEEKEVSLCKTKKVSKKHIEEASKRLYEESIIRKMKNNSIVSKEKKKNNNSNENNCLKTNKKKEMNKKEVLNYHVSLKIFILVKQ